MAGDGLFSVILAAVADFDCATIKDFPKFAVFREVLVYKGEESVSNLVLKFFLNGGLYQSMLFCCLSFHLLAVGAP